jgi:hypothetical protein
MIRFFLATSVRATASSPAAASRSPCTGIGGSRQRSVYYRIRRFGPESGPEIVHLQCVQAPGRRLLVCSHC